MMWLNPKNEMIEKAVQDCFWTGLGLNTNDYDRCSYSIQRSQDNMKVQSSIRVINWPEIKRQGKAIERMLQNYFSDFIVEDDQVNGYDLTVSIDMNQFDQNGMQDGTDESAKQKNTEKINKLASTVGLLRRHIYAAPFEFAFKLLEKGEVSEKMEYSQRADERTYIIPKADNVTVFFGVHFQDSVDLELAKLILQEMQDAKKQVKNPPSVGKMHEAQVPDQLMKEFPSIKSNKCEMNNGLISMTFFKSHITPNPDKLATYLQGFRQYVHYHIHSSKTYLHGRILKKIAALKNQINDSKFEDKGVLSYKSFKDQGDQPTEEEDKSVLRK